MSLNNLQIFCKFLAKTFCDGPRTREKRPVVLSVMLVQRRKALLLTFSLSRSRNGVEAFSLCADGAAATRDCSGTGGAENQIPTGPPCGGHAVKTVVRRCDHNSRCVLCGLCVAARIAWCCVAELLLSRYALCVVEVCGHKVWLNAITLQHRCGLWCLRVSALEFAATVDSVCDTSLLLISLSPLFPGR